MHLELEQLAQRVPRVGARDRRRVGQHAVQGEEGRGMRCVPSERVCGGRGCAEQLEARADEELARTRSVRHVLGEAPEHAQHVVAHRAVRARELLGRAAYKRGQRRLQRRAVQDRRVR
jgi:hypothetical protein